LIFFYTVGRTLWIRDQPVSSPLPIQDKKHRINVHRHPYLERYWVFGLYPSSWY
jgi:hypothetical protein